MEPIQNTGQIFAGAIDERGYVFGMDKKGFNGPRSLSEIIGNCLDAKAIKIYCIIRDEDILITDNGNGMDVENQKYLWAAQRENHKGEKTTGVSGFGAKPSTKVLSQNTEVTFYSKKDDGEYCKSHAPWSDIIKNGKYTGMVNISLMDDKEKEEFKGLLGEGTGTIIKFPKSGFLKEVITTQFNNPRKIKETNQRLDCIYSKFIHSSIYFTDMDEGIKDKQMEMYNYFGAPDHDYYHIKESTIDVLKDHRNDIVFAKVSGETYECYEYTGDGKGKGYRKRGFSSRASRKIGTLRVKSSLRKDKNYFDPSGTKLPGASTKLHAYEEKFFSELEDQVKADLFYPSIMRNDQYIGNLYPLPRLKPSSARADGFSCLKNSLIRTEISYDTTSSQDNVMDEIIGIQENKNQLNTYQIPEELKRLIEDNITDTAKEIWEIMNSKIEKNMQENERIRKEKIEKELKERIERERIERERIQKEKGNEDPIPESSDSDSDDDSEDDSDDYSDDVGVEELGVDSDSDSDSEDEILEPDSESEDDLESEPGGYGNGCNPVSPPPTHDEQFDEAIARFSEEIKKMSRAELEKKLLHFVIMSYKAKHNLTTTA